MNKKKIMKKKKKKQKNQIHIIHQLKMKIYIMKKK